MSFVVTKSSPPALVIPSKPTPAGSIPLTSTDKSRLFMPFTSFMVFERPLHEPAQKIRCALSEALVHYYPVAGRVAAGDSGIHGDVHLACTGEGVAFLSATANCTLRDVRFLHAPLVIPLDDLALRYGSTGCRMSDPLVMMQVTEFACGGYVVAVTWNHGVADAFGLAQFLQAVGDLARGHPSPAVVPVRHDASLAEIPQLLSVFLSRVPAGFEFKHVDFAYSDVTIPWSFINRVKAEFRKSHGSGGQGPCTTFEAVTAAIWQCRTRAIDADPGAPAPLVFAANVRKHIGCKDGYYGNCVSSQLVVATSGAVANGTIADVVKLIRDAKERIPESLRKSGGEVELDDELFGALCGYSTLSVTCWSGLGLDTVDFGGGRPARVLANAERTVAPSCFPCLPCSWNDDGGANVVAVCVTEEHAQAFHAELARLQ
ncbi:unnamed protein product [Urochloa humidicola]